MGQLLQSVKKSIGRYPLVNDPTRTGPSGADSRTRTRTRTRTGTGTGTLALALELELELALI